jgi:ribonuclease-3
MNNIRNKLIPKEEINKIVNGCLTSLEITVNNVDIFHQAFVHKSFVITESFVDEEDRCCAFFMKETGSNERLEFLGDSVLNMVTAEYLFIKYPSKDEGFLTKLRTKLVRNTQLSYIGSKLGFNEWLLISTSIEKINGRENPRLIEDVFESFIASLYKDQGFYVAREFIFNCFDKYVDVDFLIQNNDNYKDTLLRYFQLNLWNHPVYTTVKTEGVATNKIFTTVVLVNSDLCSTHADYKIMKETDCYYKNLYGVSFDGQYIIGCGSGKTKKESEQNSSNSTLELLKVPKNF